MDAMEKEFNKFEKVVKKGMEKSTWKGRLKTAAKYAAVGGACFAVGMFAQRKLSNRAIENNSSDQ